jgi:hypothetical protein
MGSAVALENAGELHHFSADDFTAGLLAGVAAKGKSRIPIGHPDVESGFREIVDYLRRSALKASGEGQSTFAFEILEVLDDLRPDPNSGLLEGFWSSLRHQQPGRASVPNPSYNYLQVRFTQNDAKSYLDQIPPEWRALVDQSVVLLLDRL